MSMSGGDVGGDGYSFGIFDARPEVDVLSDEAQARMDEWNARDLVSRAEEAKRQKEAMEINDSIEYEAGLYVAEIFRLCEEIERAEKELSEREASWVDKPVKVERQVSQNVRRSTLKGGKWVRDDFVSTRSFFEHTVSLQERTEIAIQHAEYYALRERILQMKKRRLRLRKREHRCRYGFGEEEESYSFSA